MNEFFDIGLPKWPAFVVTGKSVTKNQAKEILIRTGNITQLISNDREFIAKCRTEITGLNHKPYEYTLELFDNDFDSYGEHIHCINTTYGTLNIDYLINKRIATCFIGGPHGWCDWNGNISTNNYNIGKWPSVECIYDEWKLIASTFPFLELTCQLFDGETVEKNACPIIQFNISNGSVNMSIPNEALSALVDADIAGSEIGCTLDMLKDALKYTEAKVKANKK